MSSPPVRDFVPLAPGEWIHNPGYLKLDLMLKGVRIGAAALAASEALGDLVSDFGSMGDLDIVLPEGTRVSVPFAKDFAHRSPYLLTKEDGRFQIRHGDERVQVEWDPPSEFYRASTSSGVPLSRIGVIHGQYLALAPNRACSFIGQRTECKFCSAVLTQKEDPRERSVDDVLETIEFALRAQGNLSMVYLAMGYTDAEDHGIATLEPYIRAIKRHFDLLVSVDVLPPETDDWIDRTYAMGVDALSYNLEVWDPTRFEEYCPGLHENVGRDRFLQALTYAVGIFPAGAVACHLIVGLDRPLSTVDGIDWLTQNGIVPVLPLFRPFKGIDLRDQLEEIPATEEVAAVYGYLYQALKDRRIPMTWVRDLSVVTTPLEGRHFVGEEAKLQVFLQSFFNSKLGRRTAVGLAEMRRALRVREVDG
jgi:biotin synthase-related radical SAM superfamily protein